MTQHYRTWLLHRLSDCQAYPALHVGTLAVCREADHSTPEYQFHDVDDVAVETESSKKTAYVDRSYLDDDMKAAKTVEVGRIAEAARIVETG